MNKLAINGGTPVFETAAKIPAWPPADPETAELLKEIYLSHAWSFYGKHEVAFNEEFAAYTKAASCAMMANGTVTLEVAMQPLWPQPVTPSARTAAQNSLEPIPSFNTAGSIMKAN